MIQIKRFSFNAFQVNTFVLYDESGECVIIDPGCYEISEEMELENFITENKLKPVKLLNTHTHVDHILGNNFVAKTFQLKPEIHKAGLQFLDAAKSHGQVFGLSIEEQNKPANFLNEGDPVKFGNSVLEVLYTPGHIDGHVCFLSREQGFVIVGDVIFQMGIGRTDLPSGNYDLLIKSIMEKIMPLPDTYTLYPGHGPETNVGNERQNNPFLKA
jgi:hydroxyacylglutathione hydrolase